MRESLKNICQTKWAAKIQDKIQCTSFYVVKGEFNRPVGGQGAVSTVFRTIEDNICSSTQIKIQK